MSEPVGEGGGASVTTVPAAGTSAATDVSLRDHVAAMWRADERFHRERDRRYTENAAALERALTIKQTADAEALELARQIQTYKDEQHNGLLRQLGEERAHYATSNDLRGAVEKIEATLGPLATFVASQQGGLQQRQVSTGQLMAVITLVVALLAIGVGAYT